jgi:hypothetical protein
MWYTIDYFGDGYKEDTINYLEDDYKEDIRANTLETSYPYST